MSISEQVKELRKIAKEHGNNPPNPFYEVLSEAADTIESLSAKRNFRDISSVNLALTEDEYEKEVDQKIIALFLEELRLYAENCYPRGKSLCEKAANTIESLSDKLSAANKERSSDGSAWIPCKERLPEEKVNPITNDFYEYPVTFKMGTIEDVRYYKFGKGHWWYGPGLMDNYVVAWKDCTEPYHEP